MKKCISAIILLLAASLVSRAGNIVTDSTRSEILGAQVKFNVYLPSGYDRTNKLYPVVYLLHGLSDTYEAWDKLGRMQLVADELIASGEACEMVIIMPNAGGRDTHNIHNGYFNVPGWNYEDFFFNEFIPAVEDKYRCVSDKYYRAVMGLSMGGGGSIVYAQRHPDMFSSCYAMSAWLDETGQVGKKDMREDCLYYTCKSVHEHCAIDFVENADEATVRELNTVRWFIDCGDDDFLLDLSVSLHQSMKKKGINSELRVRNGVHNWEYWHNALRLSLPFASRNFHW